LPIAALDWAVLGTDLNLMNMSEENIAKINEVIAEYFSTTSEEDWVPAKAIMPALVKAGIFIKDEKNGMPLRRVLRELDKDNALDKIPFVHAERSGENTYWYLVRTGASYVPKDPNDSGVPKGQQRKAVKASSDENYVINLCDEILEQKASRQHKFGFLLGDMHKDDKTRTALPVDVYYRASNLVIEFLLKQDSEGGTSKNANRKTISGVDRAEQRKIYALRKRKGLKAKDIPVIEIDYASFECDNNTKKLTRDKDKDMKVLKRLLKDFIKEKA